MISKIDWKKVECQTLSAFDSSLRIQVTDKLRSVESFLHENLNHECLISESSDECKDQLFPSPSMEKDDKEEDQWEVEDPPVFHPKTHRPQMMDKTRLLFLWNALSKQGSLNECFNIDMRETCI